MWLFKLLNFHVATLRSFVFCVQWCNFGIAGHRTNPSLTDSRLSGVCGLDKIDKESLQDFFFLVYFEI